jgi:hypothetical protein
MAEWSIIQEGRRKWHEFTSACLSAAVHFRWFDEA